MSRLLAGAVAVLAVLGFIVPPPFPYLVDWIGPTDTWGVTGLVGAVFALAAMRGQRMMKWPLGVAAAAGILLLLSIEVGGHYAQASDPRFVLVAGASGVLMGVAALAAIFVSYSEDLLPVRKRSKTDLPDQYH